ncbi:MAG: AMP-binding enzyme [bacterium]
MEGALSSCPGVAEIWTYGDPTRSFLVGIVVPD